MKSVNEASLLEWFREQLFLDMGVRKNLVRPEADLFVDLGLDSIDSLSLLLAIDEEFDLGIMEGPESQSEGYEKARTVGDAINYVLCQTRERTSPT